MVSQKRFLLEISTILALTMLVLLLPCQVRADVSWDDIHRPFYPNIKITDREKIVLDIPASVVNNSAFLDLEVSTYDLDATEVGYLKIGESWFGNYYSLSGADKERITKTIRIRTKDLSPGKNAFYFGNRDIRGGYVFYLKSLKFLNLPAVSHRLSIASTPSGGTVYIDGKYRGKTPLTMEVGRGNYSIKVQKGGYEEVWEFYSVESDRNLTFDLQAEGHEVAVTSSPAGARVTIDDSYRGETPVSNVRLEKGSHRIILQKDGYRTITEDVVISTDTSKVSRKLEALVKPSRKVVAASSPSPSRRLIRTALVIGNADYSSAPLQNPVNDARDMADALKRRDFDVITRLDVDKRDMIKAIYEFGDRLKRSDIGLFFYAGHGMQIDGANFLIPLGTNVESAVDVEFEAVNMGRILGKMDEAGNTLNIVVLDACRNNPFRSFFRGGEQGLAKMDAPIGTIIAYATAPGQVAHDGTGRNGIFTKHLLLALDEEGLTVRDLFDRAGMGVIRETGRGQVPWIHSSPMEPVYITGK